METLEAKCIYNRTNHWHLDPYTLIKSCHMSKSIIIVDNTFSHKLRAYGTYVAVFGNIQMSAHVGSNEWRVVLRNTKDFVH